MGHMLHLVRIEEGEHLVTWVHDNHMVMYCGGGPSTSHGHVGHIGCLFRHARPGWVRHHHMVVSSHGSRDHVRRSHVSPVPTFLPGQGPSPPHPGGGADGAGGSREVPEPAPTWSRCQNPTWSLIRSLQGALPLSSCPPGLRLVPAPMYGVRPAALPAPRQHEVPHIHSDEGGVGDASALHIAQGILHRRA